MGACQSRLKQRKNFDGNNKNDLQEGSTIRIQLRRNTGIFAAPHCPIDNEEIQNTEKILGDFNTFVLGVDGHFLPEWKSVKFKKPSGINEWWYFGQWKGNQMNGKGSIYNQSHEYLINGVFQHNELNKKRCRKIFKNGSHYVGPINNNLDPQGYGELITKQEHKYTGDFVNGIPHGEGKQVLPEYEFAGNFYNGVKVKGIMRNSKGIYEGEFADNMKHGEGEMKYSNGEKYVGSFAKNKRNGTGRFQDSDGNIIQEGRWENDRLIE